MRRVLTGLCLTTSLALAGCGTTVSTRELANGPGQGLNNGLGEQPLVGGAAPGSSPVTSGSVPGSALGGSTRAPEPASQGAPSTAPGRSTPSTAPGTSTGRGVTSTAITIGIPVIEGEAALGNSLGISGAGSASPQRIAQTVVADINAKGGVLGRKLAASYYQVDAGQAVANPDAAAAAICTHYRDDQKVFAIVFEVPHPALRKCAAEMGSPLLMMANISTILSEAAYTERGGSYLYGINSISAQRLAQLYITSLEARNFHEKWNTTTGGPGGALATKLGVIHVDTPDQKILYAEYAKQLAKHGRSFAETVTYAQEVSQALAATQSAVLRFKAAGVTHVYGASAFFLQAAESQEYRPRYAYLPGLGAIGAANSPAAQLRGAMTVGWAPSGDVNAPQDPGASAAGKYCTALMTRNGMSTANRTDLTNMLTTCDALYSMRDALTAGGSASVAGLRAGFESLGTAFASALTFKVTIGPGRHHGIDAVRDMAYDTGCNCLVYTSRSNRT